MVLARLSGLFLLGPVFGSKTVPSVVKVALVLSLSLSLYPVLVSTGPSAAVLGPWVGIELSLWTLVPLMVLELALGYVIGWVVSIPMMTLQLGGYIMDYKVGLAFAQTYNPELEEQAAPISQIISMMAMALFVIFGGHIHVVEIMIQSFSWVQPGGIKGVGELLEMAVGLMQLLMEVALRIAAPILGLIFLQTVAMGFLAKTVPQLNILTVGLPLRILVGGLLLFTMVPMISRVYLWELEGVLQELVNWIQWMGR